MRKLCFLAMVLCLFLSSNLLADTLYAADSSRTELFDGTNPRVNDVRSDSSKLSVRGDNKAMKSWIEFDLSSIDVSSLTSAQLRVTLQADKDSTCLLSAVNDDVTSGYVALDGFVTWNTGPGNITSTDGINPDDGGFTVDDLQDLLDPDSTTLVGTIDYSGGTAGTQYFIDVLSILQADTDGYVLFALHGAGGNTNFATHDISLGEDYYPALVYSSVPSGCTEGVGMLYSPYAVDSSRTELFDGTNPRVDDVRSDSSKLTVRGDYKACKSWIEFDLNEFDLDPNDIRSATLRITLYQPKDNTCLLSAINDNVTSGLVALDGSVTWNTAPGNITSSDGESPDDGSFTVDDLQDNLDPNKTTLIGTVDYSEGTGGQQGDQYFMNIPLSIFQDDTDGYMLFALHGAGGNTNFATHDISLGEDYYPQLQILVAPEGADKPYPCPGDVVNTDLVGLSWTNPDPNDGVSDITCTVYLGTEPNRPEMDSITLSPGAQAVLINETNFPDSYDEVNGGLYNNTPYFWFVDCNDPSDRLIPGLEWNFIVNNNEPPVVDAGPPQVAYGLPQVISLDGTTSDDGLPDPPAVYTVLWTQVDNGAPAVTIDPNNVDDTSITFTERGDYEFMLTADDSEAQTSDTVRIVVGDDACDASHIQTGEDYDPGDQNQDCIVDLVDFANLIAKNWLDCTDTILNCGN